MVPCTIALHCIYQIAFQHYTPARTLRSESQSLAVVPRINLERYGRRAFSCAGPTLWNALPLNLRTQQDPARFRRDLKTYLFNVAYSK